MHQILPLRKKSVLTIRKSLKILLTYFWIHGLGLPSQFGPQCCRRSSLLASALLAIFFEGSTSYLGYSMLIKYEPVDSDNSVRMAVLGASIMLTLLQRFFLYSRSAAVNEVLHRLLRVYSRIPDGSPQTDLRCQLLTLLLASEVHLTLIISLFLLTFADNPLYETMTKILFDSWVRFDYVLIFWKNVGQCSALYFAFVCLALKGAFSRLKEVPCGDVQERKHLVGAYNELVDVAKSAGEAFHPAIFVTLVECLFHVFHQSFNLYYARTVSPGHSAYNVLQALYNYLRFVLVCTSASLATGAALDAKYRIYEFSGARWVGEVPKLSKYHPAFTLLDSIVVDRSLVLTASGILLTYGVMIATFTESSKKP